MADDHDENESASSLRQRLSEAYAKATAATARAVIAEKGLSHVSVDDLKGIGLDDIETKALELNEQRKRMGEDALREMLRQRGVEDVDKAVEQILNGNGSTQPPANNLDGFDRVRDVGKIGNPGDGVKDFSHLDNDPHAQMLAHFESKK